MGDILTINTEEDYDQGTRICKLPSMSVYTFNWKWNTWRGFWQNIKQWFDNKRAAKQRAKLGYCYGDIWDCGNNICRRMAHMLTHFRNKCNSWPDRSFPTFREWIEYIDEIIDLLEFAEADSDELNDYTEAFDKACRDRLDGNEPENYHEILDKYYNECRTIYEGQKGARKKALAMFAEYADGIWRNSGYRGKALPMDWDFADPDFVDDQYCYATHKNDIIYPEHNDNYLRECINLLKEKNAPIDWEKVKEIYNVSEDT